MYRHWLGEDDLYRFTTHFTRVDGQRRWVTRVEMPDKQFGVVQTATGENLISLFEKLGQTRLDNPRPCPWAGTGEEMLSYDFSFSVHYVLYSGFR
jgi:hypothetical protein